MTSGRDHAFFDDSAPANYERRLAPYLFEPWASVLLDRAGVKPGAAVIDIASGTGIVARAAAGRAGPTGRVHATDISEPMIAFARAHPADEGSAPITTAVVDAAALGAMDGDFDVALCQQGLPFFPDRPAALREMHRTLRRGGVAGIAVWSGRDGMLPFGPFHEVLDSLGVPEPFPRAWQLDSFSMSPEQVASMLQAVGFSAVECEEVELVTEWPSLDHLVDVIKGTPFAPLFAKLDDSTRRRATELLRARYATYVNEEAARVPTYATVARAVA